MVAVTYNGPDRNYLVFGSAARVGATQVSDDQINRFGRGGHVVIDMTADPTGTATFTIQGESFTYSVGASVV